MEEYLGEEFYSNYWAVILSAKKTQKNLSWDSISRKADISKNTIDIARRKNKCLGFEETIAIAATLDILIDDLIDISQRCFIRHNSKPELLSIAKTISILENEPFSQTYWRLLDGIRQYRDMKWKDIAEVSQIGYSTLSTAKSYERTLSFDKSAKLITFLGYSLDDFVSTLYSLNSNLNPSIIHYKDPESLLGRFSRLSPKNQQIVSSLIDSLLKGDSQSDNSVHPNQP